MGKTRLIRPAPIGRKGFVPALLAIGLLAIGLSACDDAADTPPPNLESFALPGAERLALPEGLVAEHPILSPNAKIETHLLLLEELRMKPHPGDGGGQAWLEAVTPIGDGSENPSWRAGAGRPARPRVPVASLQRFEMTFEVGPFGIEEGGLLSVAPSPFWAWSEAQTRSPDVAGYVRVTPRTDDVRLTPADTQDGSFFVEGRALRAGERLDIVYGAGAPGAHVDQYAERGAELMIGVDADGDGLRQWLPKGPEVDIEAREGVVLYAFGPAEVAPGEPFRVSLALVDALGNRARWPASARADGETSAGASDEEPSERFEIEALTPSTIRLPGLSIPREPLDDPSAPHSIELVAPPESGTLRLVVRGRGRLAGHEAEVNPIVVRRAARRLVWGDLHGHSALSDGTGTPEDYFGYARDVARLDVAALTDHDHWGVHPLDASPAAQAEILENVIRFHEPGRFVTLPGYEWTSWLHGHRHVLYFEDEMPIFSSIDAATDRPDELWDALRGQPALTFAHHSAGEPVATNWAYPPDPDLEPVTEVASVHGMSEAADAPLPVHGGIPGNFVRDELLRGAQLGFIGSGDSHDGHPGLAQIVSGQSGLAGLFVERLDREGVLDSLKRRHVFATNGIRPWMEVWIDDTPMGSRVDAATPPALQTLRIRFEATAPIERVDLIRSGGLVSLEPEAITGSEEAILGLDYAREIPALRPNEFHYVRIVQVDGGTAWSSPIFGPVDPVEVQALD